MTLISPRALTVLAALLLAACDNVDPPPSRTPSDPRPPAATPDSGPAGAPAPVPAASDTGMRVEVRRLGPGHYALAGRTRAAGALQLSVEDGHDVLYGPAEFSVVDGAFRTEARLERTGRPTVYAYLADPAGTRQWVVPIPRDSAVVRWPGATP